MRHFISFLYKEYMLTNFLILSHPSFFSYPTDLLSQPVSLSQWCDWEYSDTGWMLFKWGVKTSCTFPLYVLPFSHCYRRWTSSINSSSHSLLLSSHPQTFSIYSSMTPFSWRLVSCRDLTLCWFWLLVRTWLLIRIGLWSWRYSLWMAVMLWWLVSCADL